MKLLQGNLDFCLIRATCGPFRLKRKTQGPSHIHIPKGKLRLRCLWKDGLLTSSVEDRESALISRQYRVPRSFILLLYWNWCFYRFEMGVSGNLWIVVKDVKPLVYDVECEMAMDSMKGKCASSWVDLGYTNLFCIPEVTSLFSCCDSVLGDSLQFHQGNRGSLRLWLGTRNSAARNAGESGFILQRGGTLMSFIKLRQAPGVYSRVTAGMAIWNSGLFSEVRTPV